MSLYFDKINIRMKSAADEKLAVWQYNYMRRQFDFYGVPANIRNKIIKDFLKKYELPEKTIFDKIIKEFWECRFRELQYAAIQIIRQFQKSNDVPLKTIEYLTTHKPWWDTVDLIAPNITAVYFDRNPAKRNQIIDKWLSDDNIWLKRSAVIFQLRKKQKTDVDLFIYVIERLKNNDEFFIQKAIAWALREYSKTDAEFVKHFLQKNNFSNFVVREALRYLKKYQKNNISI